MKTEKRLFALVLTALVLSGAQAKAFFDPHIGRWAARDPIGSVGGLNLFCFAGNGPVGKVDADGRITIVPLLPKTMPCGSYMAFWTYMLDRPAPCDGYLVQMVTIRDKFAICGARPKVTMTEFWEAWAVAEGARTPTSLPSPLYGMPYTDSDINITPANSYGYHAVRGEVKFFCSSRIGELQESGFEEGRVPLSGLLLSTPNEPGWWRLPSDNWEKSASRFAGSSWNCCCAKQSQFNIFSFSP